MQPTLTRRPNAGISLLEVLIVLMIIGGIVGLIGPDMYANYKNSKIRTTTVQLSLLGSALEMYHLDVGHYPKSLNNLLVNEDEVSNWEGPYLRSKTMPKDGWGLIFMYEKSDDRDAYKLYSRGPNKKPDTGDAKSDDISNGT